MESNITVTPKQGEAIKLLLNKEFDEIREVLYGGMKGGGKSFLGAIWFIHTALKYPEVTLTVMRKNLTDLRLHTIPTVHEVLKVGNIPLATVKYNGQDNYFDFKNGSRISFVAAQYLPSDPYYERYGSMQNTFGWIEEGGEIPESAYENFKLSIGRRNNKEYNLPFKLLITANPKKNWMHNKFIKNPDLSKVAFIKASAKENTYLPTDYLQTLENIKDKVTRQRLLLGDWDYDDDENALIPYNKIIDSFTNSFVEAGEYYISSDVAITNDLFVCVVWSGMRIIEISAIRNISKQIGTVVDDVVINHIDFTPLLREFDRLATTYKIPRSNIVYDADGIGHKLRTLLPGAVALNNGSPAPHPGEYFNLKSELYFLFAEMINSNQIYIQASITTDLKDRLISEMQAIKRMSSDGEKLRIVPKSEVKQVLGHSPDLTDAIVYRLLFWLTRHK